jgi:hypothetical protein
MRHALWQYRMKLLCMVAGGMMAIFAVTAAIIMFFWLLDVQGGELPPGMHLANEVRIDTLWRPLDMPVPEYLANDSYMVTVIIRYDDIGYYQREVLIRWHYQRPSGKYQVIPIAGKPFTCDNVIIK